MRFETRIGTPSLCSIIIDTGIGLRKQKQERKNIIIICELKITKKRENWRKTNKKLTTDFRVTIN